MKRLVVAALVGGLSLSASALMLTGCSGGAKSSTTAGSFPNPVTLAVKAGCIPDPGVVNGQVGRDGAFMVADCTYPSATSLQVMTFKTNSERDSHLGAFPAQDGRAVIVGDKFFIDFEAPAGQPAAFDPTPIAVQPLVGGTIRQ